MNILVITAYYPPYHLGGYEIRCSNVLKELEKRVNNLTIVTTIPPFGKRQVENNIYRVLYVTRSQNLIFQVIQDMQDLRWIWKLIHQKNIDVLYLWHTIILSRTIFPFVAELDLPTVYDEGGIGLSHAWTKHGDWINYCDRKRNTLLKEQIKKTVCALAKASSRGILPVNWKWPDNMAIYFNSQAGLEAAKKARVPVDRAQVIYSGLLLDDFPFRNSLPFSNQKIRLLVPGRITQVKAIELVIRVLASLKKFAFQQRFEMMVVGPVIDKSYFEQLQRLVFHLKLEDDIKFIDQVTHEEMASLYRSAEFCLFPSQQQAGLSRVPLEAMASGCLVLSAGTEGSSEIIESGNTGFILSFEHPGDVAKQILYLLNNNSSYREIIEKARKKVETCFTIEKSVDQIEQILFNVLG